uniref:Cytochrome c oxidase polypeptide VIII-heart, mitochondrial n=1 Tax=Esox lucius TaxID=8010 RepID=C1BZR2_ESOLU|nr:Cytochrome c oxidase polypeptide VIII-heart, mitochondrial precursor [Esox lucius]
MSGIKSSVNLLRVAVRSQLVSRAALSHKPAKHEISSDEQGFALTVMFITILGPSGWILAHLEDYKHRS